MVYTAPSSPNFLKDKSGTDSSILQGEFVKVDAEIDAVKVTASALATSVGAGARVAVVYSPGAAMNAFSFNWQNPESSKILVYKAVLHVFDNETVGEGTLMNIGSASGTGVEGDNLLDGVALTTAGIFDNITNNGTNGLPYVVVDENGGTNDWITGKVTIATGASYTGYLYIFYVKVGANTV